MRFWLSRGGVLAVLAAAAQVTVAAVGVYHVAALTVLRPLMLAALVGVSLAWAAVDTWYRRLDRGINWLKAAILAGLASGVLTVIGKAAFVDQTGVAALGQALTGWAAFVALLVLVPAGLGLLVGRLLEPRETRHRRHERHRGRGRKPEDGPAHSRSDERSTTTG